MTVTLTGITSGDANISLGGAKSDTVTIADNDTAVVTIAATDATAAEPGDDGQFTVTLSNPSDTDTVIRYTVSGDANAGNDYAPVAGTVTILANSTTATIDVRVLDDNILEDNESVTVTLTTITSGDANIRLGGAKSDTVTITDDDTAVVTIVATDANAAEPDDRGQFMVTLSNPTDTDTVISYTVTGDATAGTDYLALPGTVVVAAGHTSALIDVTVIDDLLYDSGETVTITLDAILSSTPGLTLGGANTATVTIVDDNEPPSIDLINTISVDENTDTTSSVKVADIVVTDDALGTTVLTLSGTDASDFVIVGTELHVRAGTILDFETKNSYDVTVNVDDPALGTGVEDSVDFTLIVNDVNEPPTVALINTISLDENTDTTSSIKVADIVVTDDALGSETLILSGTDANDFVIVGTELHIKAGTILDYETKSSYDVRVNVDDATLGTGMDDFADFTLMINDLNESPYDISPDNFYVDEHIDTNGGRLVGTLVTSDPDTPETFRYSLKSGGDKGSFRIGGAANDQLFIDDGVLDFETKSSYVITVSVKDSAGNKYEEMLTVHVNDLNEAPTATDNTIITNEETSHTFTVADFNYSDANSDPFDHVRITSLESNGNLQLSGADVILGQTILATDIAAGKLTFRPIANQTGTPYDSFEFQVHDGIEYSTNTFEMTIDVAAINDEPSFTMLGNQTTFEDAGLHTVLGFATPFAGGGLDESGQKFAFTTNNDNPGLFVIGPAVDGSGTLTYTLAENAYGSATVTISVSDDGGTANGGDDTSPDQTFTITVDPVNDPPMAHPDTSATGENASVTVDVLANDTDVDDDPAVFSLDSVSILPGGSGGSVSISGNQLVFDPGTDFDHLDSGATEIVTVSYTMSDDDGASDSSTVLITVMGTDDAAVVTGSFLGNVIEGNIGDPAVTASGTLAISDPDDGDTPVFQNTATGTYGNLVLVNGVWTYTLDQSTVQQLDAGDVVTDAITLTADNGIARTVTITVIGTNDLPLVTGLFTGTVAEGNIGDAPVTATGSIAINDLDEDDNPSFADTSSAGVFGSLELVNGNWTYTLDQNTVQHLHAGDLVHDAFTLTADNGISQDIDHCHCWHKRYSDRDRSQPYHRRRHETDGAGKWTSDRCVGYRRQSASTDGCQWPKSRNSQHQPRRLLQLYARCRLQRRRYVHVRGV